HLGPCDKLRLPYHAPDHARRPKKNNDAIGRSLLASRTLILHIESNMSDNSKIEWTDATWNPVRGCAKVSPGCLHCYAETFAERFRGVPGHPFEFGFDLRLVPEKLGEPIRWSKPKKIFVNSMSDLFHEDVSDEYIEKVCRVMLAANWHTYQILTKRADRLATLLQGKLRDAAQAAHIWWGVSVENRKHGLPRIAKLREAKATVAFLSVEPLLEDLGALNLNDIHWVIVGGESGPGARPIDELWVRSIRDQCQQTGIPFFFKQWGGVRKKETGRQLDGRTYDEFPEVRFAAAPSSSRLVVLREAFEIA
ncbi:MAG TPA: phage Gp37/Gp68 family protein, partial [Candidatus Saccharimonadales bacterium]|nr:phage Gp37/Gp68 family protein [Candidatus Saccharimonadales bacterium]